MGDNASEELTTAQRDRACGVLLGAAAGDALATSRGGEWSDGPAMAIPVAELAAMVADLRHDAIQDRLDRRWSWWATTVKDAGAQLPSAVPTAPVVLTRLHDDTALADTARTISALAQNDVEAGDACVLWCAALRHAVLTGHLDIRIGLSYLDSDRRQRWMRRFDEAEHSPMLTAGDSGLATALPGAWSAITHTPLPTENPAKEVFRVDHLRWTLEAVSRAGGTAEVAAIAGGLLGATYGASAVPWDWRLSLRGWPGLRARDLIRLADNIIGAAEPEWSPGYWSEHNQHPGRRHPHDEQVYLAGVGPLARPAQYVPTDVDAIVSLCGVFDTYLIRKTVQLDVRLAAGEGERSNLEFVLLDTVRAIEGLRAEGRTVFLHSMLGRSRAPAVAALYGARKRGIGIEEALADVLEVIPDADPDRDLRAALRRLAGAA